MKHLIYRAAIFLTLISTIGAGETYTLQIKPPPDAGPVRYMGAGAGAQTPGPAHTSPVWGTLGYNNVSLVRNGKPFFPSDCLASGGDAISCGIKRSEVLSDHNPTLDFVAQFPMLKPLDMSNAVCRQDYCRAVEGNVLLYHDSHHISTTYMRTMTNELGRQIAAATGWW